MKGKYGLPYSRSRLKPAFIYFDLDDTLLDHLGAERKAQLEVWHTFPELQKVSPERWVEMYSTNNRELWEMYGKGEISKHILQEQRFSVPMKALGISTHRSVSIGDAYLMTYEKYWAWNDGAHDVLNRIANVYRCGILTNGFEKAQERKFERFGLTPDRFILIISERSGFTKPQRGIFDYAAALAKSEPDSLLYIGDNYLSDIEGAHNAGWKTVWFNPKKTERSINVADATISRFDELLTLLELP